MDIKAFIQKNRFAIPFILILLGVVFALIGMIANGLVPPGLLIFILLAYPGFLVIMGVIVAWIMTKYSNRDNILEKIQFYVTFILYSYTVIIFLFAILVFAAIVFFQDIQTKLANLFTAVGFVLSFLAIALSLGFSVDSVVSNQRSQRDVGIKIESCTNKQKIAIQKDIRDVFQQLQLEIQNQNYYIGEIVENHNRHFQMLQAQSDHFEEINNIRFRILQDQYCHIEKINEINLMQLRNFIQDSNKRLENSMKITNPDLKSFQSIENLDDRSSM